MLNHSKLFFVSSHTDSDLLDPAPITSSLLSQTEAAIKSLSLDCNRKGLDINDLVKLVVYLQHPDDWSEADYLAFMADKLNMSRLPVITLIPLRQINASGCEVVFDAYGVKNGHILDVIAQETSPFNLMIRADELIFTGALTPTDTQGQVCYPNDVVKQSEVVLKKLDQLLEKISATRQDIVKINNWYVASGTAEQWRRSASVRAKYYPEPGPVATGLPLEALNQKGMMIQTDCWLMAQADGQQITKQFSWPENHWDWPIHLPFKHGLKCGDMVFVGGQVSMNADAEVVDPDDIIKQSHTSMTNIAQVLKEFDLGLDDVVKINAYYKMPASIGDLKNSIEIRSHHLGQNNPDSISIALSDLAYQGMLTEFEVIAIANRR